MSNRRNQERWRFSNRGNMAEKSRPLPSSCFDELFVQRRRRLTHRRVGIDGLGRGLRQPQVLEHQLCRKAGLVVIVGRRFRAHARRRAVGVDAPAGARRGADHVEHLVACQSQLVGQRESLAGCDHGDAKDHVVADLGGLAIAGGAAMHGLLAHDVEKRFRLGKAFVTATGHEGQRARGGSADAAGNRRVDGQKPRARSLAGHCARAFDIDRRAIEQERALVHRRNDFIGHACRMAPLGSMVMTMSRPSARLGRPTRR